jgi:hypothetical protein
MSEGGSYQWPPGKDAKDATAHEVLNVHPEVTDPEEVHRAHDEQAKGFGPETPEGLEALETLQNAREEVLARLHTRASEEEAETAEEILEGDPDSDEHDPEVEVESEEEEVDDTHEEPDGGAAPVTTHATEARPHAHVDTTTHETDKHHAKGHHHGGGSTFWGIVGFIWHHAERAFKWMGGQSVKGAPHHGPKPSASSHKEEAHGH